MNAVYSHIRRTWDGYYVAAKLRSDPLYEAVLAEIGDSPLPLLDLGCGLGLLAFYLREKGVAVPIHSLDYDRRKIDEANRLVAERGLTGLSFAFHDAREGLPDHHGNVTILDILQFFTPEEIETLLKLAAERVAPGGKLVIRSCLRDTSGRYRATVAGDILAKCTFWMKAAPTHYPSRGDLERVLSNYGEVRISPLWGATPFNNHLIVLEC
ncbi:class I SAM-dependent methyltransferase [Haloferula sargassicola]|uniref:Methyltransferase domain-containing protein n=1 Tax=Haloferula sargassicola TaxID=490096 RepID=A0ABP9ULZ1_9BACT